MFFLPKHRINCLICRNQVNLPRVHGTLNLAHPSQKLATGKTVVETKSFGSLHAGCFVQTQEEIAECSKKCPKPAQVIFTCELYLTLVVR